MKRMILLLTVLILSCAKVSESSMGGMSGLMLAIGGIESTYRTAPLIEMNFQFQKGSGDYLSQKVVTYEFITGASSNASRVVYSTDNGEGITDEQGRYKVILSTVGQMKFKILEIDRTPIGSFTTTVAAVMTKEDVKMENVEGNLGIQVLSISNNYNQFTSTEPITNIEAPSALAYSSSSYVMVRDTTIPTYTPTNKGTAPLTFSISPSLPVGLSFSTETGAISGTPTAITPSATYKISVSNSKGSTSTNLVITVNDSPPKSLVYTPSIYVLTRGVSSVNTTPTVSGNTTSYSILPTLPAGMSFNTTNGRISGTPTSIQGTTAHTVTVNNTAGFSTSLVYITVNDVPPSNLSYPSSTYQWIKNTAYSISSTVTGQNVTYQISPPLPVGLSISSSTGVISGTPTVASENTTYTITASNSGGNTTTTMQIVVLNEIPPSGFAYSGAPFTLARDSNYSFSPTLSSGQNMSYTIVPATLPTGLQFSSSTGILSGTPTVLTNSSNYTITASNSGGTVSIVVSIEVIPLYLFSGILSNVSVSTLAGWTKCYSESFGMSSTSTSSLKSSCSKNRVLLSCRTASNPNVLLLAAYADRSAVFNTSTANGNSMVNSNNVGWYYGDSYSMGFAPAGATISRNSCDTASGSQHMCWHTSSNTISGGYRCGDATGLNGSSDYVREAFHAD